MAAALLALPSMAPLFGPGLIGTHRYGDSPFLLVRLVSLTEGLRRGEVVPRWSPELSYGLGYPFWDFYAPLAYYLAAVPYLLGVTAVASLKLVQALGFVGASLATFALARRHLGELGGLVVAAAYGYAPYHLVNVYARGTRWGSSPRWRCCQGSCWWWSWRVVGAASLDWAWRCCSRPWF